MTLGGIRCLVLLAIAIGVLVFALGGSLFEIQGDEPWLWLVETLSSHRESAAAGAMVLLALEVAFQLTRTRRTRYRKTLTTKTKEGEVTVGVSALKAELSRIADAHQDLVSLDPVILPKKKGMDVELDVRVKGGSQLPSLCSALQDEARRAVADNVGVFKVDRVTVNIRELVRDKKPKAPPAEEAVEASEETSVDDEAEAPTRAAEDT